MNEATEVQTTTKNIPQKGEFYVLGPDMRGSRGHGVVFENENKFPWPPHMHIGPSSAGIKEFKEVPRLRQSRPNDMPSDLDSDFRGYWLVSEPLKQLFESIDPEGFEFASCDFILNDGSKAPAHYLCDIVRVIDAIDEDASKVKILTEGYSKQGKHYSLAGGASLAFRKTVIDSAHIFRTPYNSRLVICDQILRNALVENGFGKPRNSRGVWLIDAANY
ncbi:imm11 family protein [Xanthomonas fragariae]|uniref:imm11 family protein n=1 Tax=Xanthomonas fragariae TaxID=48664 RepID=UPI0022AA4700|nr:DUF1629 domain-containing protein [Xanthomonas fragariae]WAT13703.1 DUF1629 domain-containing protein [Xanthomonas fragariae]